MIAPLRTLIIDDEPPALRVLERMIARHDGVRLVGTAIDGIEALAVLAEQPVDLLIADIAMPRLAGLTLVERVEDRWPMAVVLVTAHAEHAARAFDLGVADYVLKPVAPERFDLAIARARTIVASRSAMRVAPLLRGLTAVPAVRSPEHLWVHVPGGRERVRVSDVEVIRAEADYVRVFAGDAGRLADGPLEQLAGLLAGAGFLRVHRSALVRLDAVQRVEADPSRRLLLTTTSGHVVVTGKRTTPDLRAVLLSRG